MGMPGYSRLKIDILKHAYQNTNPLSQLRPKTNQRRQRSECFLRRMVFRGNPG